jgi:peptide/nickel transport system substrate-binding protein
LACAIDNYELTEIAFDGYCIPIDSMYLPNVEWVYNPDALQPAYDPERAEQLLDEAGYPRGSDGVRFTAVMSGGTSMGQPDSCEYIKQKLSEVGIEVTLELLEWGVLSDKVLDQKDFDIAHMGGMQGPEPNMWAPYVTTGGHRNNGGFSNARVDELFELGKASGDIEKRAEYYKEAQAILAEELPRVSLYVYSYAFPYNPDFQGFFFQEEMSGKVRYRGPETIYWTKATGVAEPIDEPVVEPIAGEQGPQGPPGEQGPQGPPGEPASMTFVYGSLLMSLIALVVAYMAYTKN